MIQRPPRPTLSSSSAASDVYKRRQSGIPMSALGPRLQHSPGLYQTDRSNSGDDSYAGRRSYVSQDLHGRQVTADRSVNELDGIFGWPLGGRHTGRRE